MSYTRPKIAIFDISMVNKCYAKNESCTVVCTYMYGYCGDKEGWGTTHCPKWAQ